MSEVGLIITSEDKATAMMDSIGKAGTASLEGIRDAAGKASAAFATLGKATVVFNQAMELGRKALDTFRILVGDTIRTALDFRKLGDPAIEAFKNMERQALVLRARLGDILIPLAQGLHDAFVGVGNGVVEWINANRKLIATNIATWMADIARIAIKGVAFGVVQIARAWQGWAMIVDTTKIAVNTAFAALLSGAHDALLAMSDLALAVGDEGLARNLDDARKSVWSLGVQFSESADNARTSLEEEAAALDMMLEKIAEWKSFGIDFVGEAEVAMLKRIKASRIGGIRTIEEQKTALEKLKEAEDKAAAAALARQQAQIAIGQSMAANLQAYMTSEEDVHDRRRALFFSTMQVAIAASSTEAAVKAIAAHTHIPFVGVAIGLAFAAAAVSAIATYANTQFATGGVFRARGGTGQATLHDKERVLSQRQTESFEHLVDWLGASQGPAAAGAGGGTFIYNQTVQSFLPPSDADFSRATREQERVRLRLKRRGMLS